MWNFYTFNSSFIGILPRPTKIIALSVENLWWAICKLSQSLISGKMGKPFSCRSVWIILIKKQIESCQELLDCYICKFFFDLKYFTSLIQKKKKIERNRELDFILLWRTCNLECITDWHDLRFHFKFFKKLLTLGFPKWSHLCYTNFLILEM